MLPLIGQYIEHSQVYSDPTPTLEAISNELHKYNVSHLLQLFGKTNIALWKTERNHKEFKELQEHLMKIFFGNEDKTKIINLLNRIIREDKARATPFHRHQMLMAIKLCLLNPNKEGLPVNNTHVLGKLLLAISENLQEKDSGVLGKLFDSLHFEFTRKTISRIAYFSHNGRFVNNISRAISLWINIPKTSRFNELLKVDSVNINVEQDFIIATGLTIEEFITLGLTNLSKLHNLDIYTKNPHDFMHQNDFWSLTALEKNKQDKLSGILSQSIFEFKENYKYSIEKNLKGNDVFVSNFMPLLDKPLININNDLSIVADPQYFEEKISSGPYWILLNYYKDEKKKRNLAKYFGLLHQEYTHTILLNICDNVIEIKRKDDHKRCDYVGIINSDRGYFLLFIEAKKIALSLTTILLGEYDVTIQNLSKVFGEDGFGQVYASIKQFEEGVIEELENINKDKVIGIFPIVITDRFIVEESLNRNLYERIFLNNFNNPYLSKPNISKPIFFSTEEIEIIEGASEHKYKFSILDFLLYRNKKLHNRFFRGEQKQFLKNQGFVINNVGWIVKDLDTIWNDLYFTGYTKYINKRLKRIFDTKMNKLKRKLFPKDRELAKK